MSNEFEKSIRDQKLLQGLTEKQVAAFAKRCEIRSFEMNDQIIRAGELTKDLHVLVEGQCSIEVDVTEEVKHFVVQHLVEGDIFGEMSFLDGSPRSATVVCTMPCKVLVISPEAFDELVKEEASLGITLMKNIATITAHKMRKTHQRLKNLYWKGQMSSQPDGGGQ